MGHDVRESLLGDSTSLFLLDNRADSVRESLCPGPFLLAWALPCEYRMHLSLPVTGDVANTQKAAEWKQGRVWSFVTSLG